jgi:hypothetical protein
MLCCVLVLQDDAGVGLSMTERLESLLQHRAAAHQVGCALNLVGAGRMRCMLG